MPAQVLKVMCQGLDSKGLVRLSHKATLPVPEAAHHQKQQGDDDAKTTDTLQPEAAANSSLISGHQAHLMTSKPLVITTAATTTPLPRTLVSPSKVFLQDSKKPST